MARKRKYGSAMGGENNNSGPYLESLNLPDENYYRNMTESPMELMQPHMSTNPIKHGINKTNINYLLSVQDKCNNDENRAIPKLQRRTLISEEFRSEGNIEEAFYGSNKSIGASSLDILQDDLSSRNQNMNSNINNMMVTVGYNTRNRTKQNLRQNTMYSNKNDNFVRKKAEKGSSNLPPLPRTEDYWPKINRDGIQEHENYLNSIRNQHFNKKKLINDEYSTNNNFVERNEINDDSYECNYNIKNNNFGKEIYSIETPLKAFRSESIRSMYEKKFENIKPLIRSGNLRREDLLTENEVLSKYKLPSNDFSKTNIDNIDMIKSRSSDKKKEQKLHCDVMVGGDTPLRKFYSQEIFENKINDIDCEIKTNDVGVGPSPKAFERIENMQEEEIKSSQKIMKTRTNGSILRKSIDILGEQSKQVKFSAEKSNIKKEEVIPEIEELNFDPSEVPLIEYHDNEDIFDTVDFDETNSFEKVKVDDYKILDSLSVDSNILLRIAQLSKEEIRLFESTMKNRSNNENNKNSIDDDLMIKAISGIHRYYLNKVVEYENKKDLQMEDMLTLIPDTKFTQEKHQSANLEREELINKIGLLNLNINKLTVAIEEAEQLKSQLLNNSKRNNVQDNYILKCAGKIIDCLDSINSEKINGDVDKSDTSNLSSPTPILPSDDNNIDSSKEIKKDYINVDELLNECHHSQFVQMESIAILNDCMSLLDDAEIGMQNFQKLLARKAFDTQDDGNQYSVNNDYLFEDTFLKIQKGASITPRFSLEENLQSRTSVGTNNIKIKKSITMGSG